MLHPSSRFSIALLLSLALWSPTLRATLGGSVDPIDASLRWVGAFAVASIGIRVIGGLLDSYAATPEPVPVDSLEE